MKTDLCSLSALELLKLYRTKKVSPVEATRAVLERIEKLNPVLNAFCVVDKKQAIQSATQSEKRWLENEPKGLLDGVPVSIKDLILTKGWPTLRGSRRRGVASSFMGALLPRAGAGMRVQEDVRCTLQCRNAIRTRSARALGTLRPC